MLFGAGVLAYVGGFLLLYGTLSPCEALKTELRRAVMRSVATIGRQDTWTAAGTALGLALSNPMIETAVGAMGPLDCLSALPRASQQNFVAAMVQRRMP